MHVRWSAMRGMLVIDEETQDTLGALDDVLINPDTGRILGFFVHQHGAMQYGIFLQTCDILSIAMKVHVQSARKLSPMEDLIRMQKAFDDPRTFLGQRIRARDSGRSLGFCRDIQFDTRSFALQWLFPRGWIFAKQPIAAEDIVEVTEEAIVVDDPLRRQRVKEQADDGKAPISVSMVDAAPSMRSEVTIKKPPVTGGLF